MTIQRLTKREVSHHRDGVQLMLSSADLREMEVEAGDELTVETHDDKIIIKKGSE